MGHERAGIKQQRGQPRLVGGWSRSIGTVCALFSPFFGRAKKGRKLNCNQFEKTTTGLPFAYGIYVDSTAGMEFIGGVQVGQTPSGNGWVGLNPGNSGYAVWNHPGNVQLTYFSFNNEQIFQPDVFTTTVDVTSTRANPYINPITLQVDPNAHCIDNPAVYFAPRPIINKSNEDSLGSNPISKLSDKRFRVFPNPTFNEVKVVSLSDVPEAFSAQLLNFYGREIKKYDLQVQELEIYMTDLVPGFYTLVIFDTQGVAIQREVVVKQ